MYPSPANEISSHSRDYTHDGVTVAVTIIRGTEPDRWRLEVMSREGQLTEWSDDFATDQEALEEFLDVLQTEGIQTFL